MTAPAQLPLFAVRRSTRARRARLTVTESGEALVVLPTRAPATLAAGLVARHVDWLERHQRRIAAERRALAQRPRLGEGRTLTLRGIEHALVIQESARRRWSVALAGGALPAIVVRRAAASSTGLAEALATWLRAEARRDIEAAVARRAAEIGVSVGKISVRDQRTRWGSASPRGGLSFSWRLVLAPPEVLDYVVVHELAHLRWRGHGPRFWAMVRRHAPSADAQRKWLRDNHRWLRAALTEGAA